ncbi:MAG: hypothetical protein WDA41_09780, partial [Candidatus Neomarinimicrobiota bacterium]
AGGTTGSVVTTDDVDDTPVDAATTAPISSNWAYDHAASANPHPEVSGLLASFSLHPATVAVGTGEKTFATGVLGKAFFAGMKVIAARSATPTDYWMYGSVTSYDPDTGALVIDSELFKGMGSFSDWKIYVSGEIAAPGVGQTWTNVTATRSLGELNANSTGKPIFVKVITTAAGSTYGLVGAVEIAGVTFSGFVHSGATSVPATIGVVEMLVPNGSAYRVYSEGATIFRWLELR